VRFEIEPISGPADEIPSMTVIDGPVARAVTITVTVTDAKDHRWESRCVFRTDAAGTVDLARDTPVSGSYGSVDPAGPIRAMRLASEDIAPSMFAAPSDQLELTFTAEADGAEAATATTVRRWSAPGVTRSEIRDDAFIGYLFKPAEPGRNPAVAVIPGTTGVPAMEPTAGLLASHGYTAMVVGYMGIAGLPPSLCEIALETLAAGIRRLSAHPTVDSGRVGVLCASVGAEGALAALSEIDDLEVRAIMAISPSSVIWQGMAEGRPPQKSSWTLGGAPLPWVPIHGERLLPELIKNALLKGLSRHPRPSALHLRSACSTGLRNRAAAARAAIRAERIGAPILLLSGEDDQRWPGTEMAAALMRRRAEAGRRGIDIAASPTPATSSDRRSYQPRSPGPKASTRAAPPRAALGRSRKRGRRSCDSWASTSPEPVTPSRPPAVGVLVHTADVACGWNAAVYGEKPGRMRHLGESSGTGHA
jgi:dienelactone hydrolase